METRAPHQQAIRPVLSEHDVYLLAEGTYRRAYERLGAHLTEVDGVRGVHFAVWAPNARYVSVIGSHNGWDAAAHPMLRRGAGGIWERFIPGVEPGAAYKFHNRSSFNHYQVDKADPYAFAAEAPPGTASRVYDLSGHTWTDTQWLSERTQRQGPNQPLSIYEVHAGSWRRVPAEGNRSLTYRELAHQLVPYVKRLGYTHIELMPITEYPFDQSWGYQVTGYFAPTARYGTPHDLMYFVDYCHQHGVGVLLDWVPAHFAKEEHGLGFFDGTHLYEHANPALGEHPTWGTFIFNYGRPEVRNFLLSSALFWLEQYHVDGFRVDAVASMIWLDHARPESHWATNRFGGRENLEAVDFLHRLNALAHESLPDEIHTGAITIAEESTSYTWVTWFPERDGASTQGAGADTGRGAAGGAGRSAADSSAANVERTNAHGGPANVERGDADGRTGGPAPQDQSAARPQPLGFDFKWNLGWMHDTLDYFQTDPLLRSGQHHLLTFPIWYAFNERYLLPLSHDEVVHLKKALLTKMPGDDRQRFANLRALLAYMTGHPGKKLLFMGGEFGQWSEWSESRSLDWHLVEGSPGYALTELHQGLQRCVAALNQLYRGFPALHALDSQPRGFEWIDHADAPHSVITFLRRGTAPGQVIVVACNFTPVVRPDYSVGVPIPGPWHEALNTDSPQFGGTGVLNPGPLQAQPVPGGWGWSNGGARFGQTLRLTLPPLGVSFYVPGPQSGGGQQL